MRQSIISSSAASSPKGAMVQIASYTVPNSTTPDCSFLNIPQIYTDLVVVSYARRTEAATLSQLYILPNSSTSTGSSTLFLTGNGSSTSTGRYTTQDAWFNGTIPGGTSASGLFGYGTLEIFDYTSSSKFKTGISKVSSDLGGSSGEVTIRTHLTRSQTPVNAVYVTTFSASNYFAIGSTFSLYGIRSVNQ